MLHITYAHRHRASLQSINEVQHTFEVLLECLLYGTSCTGCARTRNCHTELTLLRTNVTLIILAVGFLTS